MRSQVLKSILLIAIVGASFGLGALLSALNGAQPVYSQTAIIGNLSSNDLGSQNQVAASTSINVIMTGDIMFDRTIRLLGEKNGYDSLFANVAPLLHGADITVANLEGPITTDPSQTLLASGATTNELAFTFATTTAMTLARAGVSLVSLANNHADNLGRQGYEETKNWLKGAGVGYFGNSWNDTSTEALITKNGITVAFVGYHAFLPGIENTISDIKRLSSEGDFVIVMPHWGVEYDAHPTQMMTDQANLFIAAGAKAIIGAHTHVIGDYVTLNGIPIFYSLGNFVFDQYFSPDVMSGNLLELHITKDAEQTKIDKISGIQTSMTSQKQVDVSNQPEIIDVN